MSVPAVIGCAAAVLLAALPVVAGGAALEARHQLDGAADAAALAAADALSGWIDANPCGIADEVLAKSAATLESCRLDEMNGEVRLVAKKRTMLGTARSRVHAGPSFT